MTEKIALIFGVNDFAFEIKKNVESHYEKIYIYRLDEDGGSKYLNDSNILLFDLSDNWDDLSGSVDMNKCVAFCVLDDMAKNIFLTISLRDSFEKLNIIALAQDKESADKLKLAGASVVIPATQTTANVIVEMLEKPIVREVMHHILYEKSSLKIAQIKIENSASFSKRYLSDIDWGDVYGILVLSVVCEDFSDGFIYSARAKHHIIKNGDILVVVGYDEDIENFKKRTGNENG